MRLRASTFCLVVRIGQVKRTGKYTLGSDSAGSVVVSCPGHHNAGKFQRQSSTGRRRGVAPLYLCVPIRFVLTTSTSSERRVVLLSWCWIATHDRVHDAFISCR